MLFGKNYIENLYWFSKVWINFRIFISPIKIEWLLILMVKVNSLSKEVYLLVGFFIISVFLLI